MRKFRLERVDRRLGLFDCRFLHENECKTNDTHIADTQSNDKTNTTNHDTSILVNHRRVLFYASSSSRYQIVELFTRIEQLLLDSRLHDIEPTTSKRINFDQSITLIDTHRRTTTTVETHEVSAIEIAQRIVLARQCRLLAADAQQYRSACWIDKRRRTDQFVRCCCNEFDGRHLILADCRRHCFRCLT